jgi:GNAT superfamily N-acetyltransferase
MADFQVAFNWTMDSEDEERHYLVAPDAPPGAFAISGINSAAFPEDFERIKAAPQVERPALVEAFYRAHFWDAWMQQLSDEVAKRVMDARFNQGQGTGVRILQHAVNEAAKTILDCDGLLGEQTITAANRSNQAELVATFKAARCQKYRDLADANPALMKYLPGWLARAQK